MDDFRRELDVVRGQNGAGIRFQILQGRLPADAARGRHHKITLRLHRRPRLSVQLHHHNVGATVAWATYPPNLGNILEHSFGMQKPRGQFEIVSGSSHGDGEAAISQSNLEGLFDRQQVVGMRCGATFPPADRYRNHRDVHRAFPTLSNRSSVTAIAWRLFPLPARRSSCSTPGARCAFSRSAPSEAVRTRLFKTSGGMLAKNFVNRMKLRIPRRDSGAPAAAVKMPANWSPAPTNPRSKSRTPRSCRTCKSSSADTMASVCLSRACARRSASAPLGVSVNGIGFAMGLYASRFVSICTSSRRSGRHR